VALDMEEGDPPAPVNVPEFHSKTGISVVTGLPQVTGARVAPMPVTQATTGWRTFGLVSVGVAALAAAGALFAIASRPVLAPATAASPRAPSRPAVEALPSPIASPPAPAASDPAQPAPPEGAAPAVDQEAAAAAARRRSSGAKTKRPPVQKGTARPADTDRRPNPFE
jgi:hypothetical protein